MSAKIMSVGEFNQLERVTPTGLSEEVYQARLKLKQNQPMPIGPTGLEIPAERTIYRPTIDGKLLTSLVAAAYADRVERGISAEEHASAATSLADAVLLRFPPADAAVLERYGFAEPRDSARVTVFAPEHHYAFNVPLPFPVVVPSGGAIFHMNHGGKDAGRKPPVPRDVVPYCLKVVELRRDKLRIYGSIAGAPGRFKVAKGRWPRWAEIEREFPIFGAWLQRERAQIKAPSK